MTNQRKITEWVRDRLRLTLRRKDRKGRLLRSSAGCEEGEQAVQLVQFGWVQKIQCSSLSSVQKSLVQFSSAHVVNAVSAVQLVEFRGRIPSRAIQGEIERN